MSEPAGDKEDLGRLTARIAELEAGREDLYERIALTEDERSLTTSELPKGKENLGHLTARITELEANERCLRGRIARIRDLVINRSPMLSVWLLNGILEISAESEKGGRR